MSTTSETSPSASARRRATSSPAPRRRRSATGRHHRRMALEQLAALRRLDLNAPGGHRLPARAPRAADPTQSATSPGAWPSASTRAHRWPPTASAPAFRAVTQDTIDDARRRAVTAAVDARGTPLVTRRVGRDECPSTIGRQATSRGVADRVGQGRTVTIDAGECAYSPGVRRRRGGRRGPAAAVPPELLMHGNGRGKLAVAPVRQMSAPGRVDSVEHRIEGVDIGVFGSTRYRRVPSVASTSSSGRLPNRSSNMSRISRPRAVLGRNAITAAMSSHHSRRARA